ncbi:glutamate receptor ionotropic, kainate 2-like [Tachypleus tridentatus]|uniref:glutamate receptor ionotropic, kainate 2-like n=1 Tax=Tachypleus tridentatus TaxID=6853 RepID=UPI003FD3AF68
MYQNLAKKLGLFPLSMCFGSTATCRLQTAIPHAFYGDVVAFASYAVISVCKECSWVHIVVLTDSFYDAVKMARIEMTLSNSLTNTRVIVRKVTGDEIIVERFLRQAFRTLVLKSKTVFVVICNKPITDIILKTVSKLSLFDDRAAWLFLDSKLGVDTNLTLLFSSQILSLRLAHGKDVFANIVSELDNQRNESPSSLFANSSAVNLFCGIHVGDVEPVPPQPEKRESHPEVKMNLVHILMDPHERKIRERSIAEWSSWSGLRSLYNGTSIICTDLKGARLKVTTIHAPPYIFVSKDDQGNLTFHGYLIDVIETLSKYLNFEYTLRNVTDSSYGLYNSTKKTWDGVIGELSRGESDIGLGNFNPSKERSAVVDFLITNIEHGGLRIITLRNRRTTENVLSFAAAVQGKVWLCLLGTMVITVALMALTNRVKVADNENNSTSEAYNSKEKWASSVFFVYSALLQQGSYVTPNTISGRSVFIVWWLLSVVCYACYTAILTSSFAVKEPPAHINSIYDLLNTPGYKFGMRKGTFHVRYFKETLPNFYEQLTSFPSDLAFTDDEEQGVQNVLGYDCYAYLGDELVLRYLMGDNNCELRQSTETILPSGYHLPVRKNFPFRQAMDRALLQMYEAGILRYLKQKWWPRLSDCRLVSSAYVSLDFHQLVLPFIILLTSLCAALWCLVGETIFDIWKRKRYQRSQKKYEQSLESPLNVEACS